METCELGAYCLQFTRLFTFRFMNGELITLINVFGYTPYAQFVELHGDRSGYDDPAIVTGIGTIDGRRYMFMGHQKGRNTKENVKRNFGMPTPHGYVK